MSQAVLIMAYGGPDTLDDIEPYLLDIRGGRPTSQELVAEVRERYARIGGRSPLLEITRAQARALEQCLNDQAGRPGEFRVYVGMRHWKPYIRDVVAQISADGIRSGLAFCMAPHASRMSTGAYLQKLKEAQASLSSPLELKFIESWYDQPFLIEALAQKVRSAAQRFSEREKPRVHYLFSAHSLPAALKEAGDPYEPQLLQTAGLLAGALDLPAERWSFGYQSAGASSVPWLGPDIAEVLPRLAEQGIREVLVTPVGFMADHVEVLYDLDIEAQEIARAHGIHLERSESLNASPGFIEGLAKFLLQSI